MTALISRAPESSLSIDKTAKLVSLPSPIVERNFVFILARDEKDLSQPALPTPKVTDNCRTFKSTGTADEIGSKARMTSPIHRRLLSLIKVVLGKSAFCVQRIAVQIVVLGQTVQSICRHKCGCLGITGANPCHNHSVSAGETPVHFRGHGVDYRIIRMGTMKGFWIILP